MAPPRNRRPGFSRRIQFGLFIGYIVAVIGAVTGIGLVMLSRLDPEAFRHRRGAVRIVKFITKLTVVSGHFL